MKNKQQKNNCSLVADEFEGKYIPTEASERRESLVKRMQKDIE